MDIEQRKQWLAWRKIGASDIAAMVHEVYGGQYAVVANLLGHDTDLGDNIEEKARGHAWEERIADAVQNLYGMFVVGEQAWITHATEAHHTATVDGFLAWLSEASLADVVALLEVKTVHEFADMHWDRWTTQCRWGMHCSDTDRALIAAARMDVDLEGNETVGALTFQWVERDLDLEADLVALADETWGYVQRNELPTPNCASAISYVKKLTAIADMSDKPDAVDLDDIAGQIERLGALKAAKNQASDEHDKLYSIVAARLGQDRAGVTSSGWRVSYSKPSQKLDEDAALTAHPTFTKTVFDRAAAEEALGKKALDAYKAPIGHRTLTITPPKDQT